MKNIILTLRIEDKGKEFYKEGYKNKELYEICEITQRLYAQRIGAEYKILEKTKMVISDGEAAKLCHKTMVYLQKLQLLRFTDYDHVLYLDGDVLINPESPNIFEVFPETDIYRGYQQLGVFEQAAIPYINKYAIEWEKRSGQYIYYNGGVQLFGKDCNLSYALGEYLVTAGHDETFVCYLLQKNKVKNLTLPAKWNKMDIDTTIDRREGYFIHYGGTGWTGITMKGKRGECEREKLKIAEEDYKYFYGGVNGAN